MIKKLHIIFLCGLLVLVLDATIPLVLAKRIDAMQAAATAATAVDTQLTQLLSAYKDAETGQRGFLLTGQTEFLGPYSDGRSVISRLLPQIVEQLAGDPRQAPTLQRLRYMDSQSLMNQQQGIEARRQNTPVSTEEALRGKQVMDGIRADINAISTNQRQRASSLHAKVQHLSALAYRSLWLVTAVDMVLFIAVFLIARSATRLQFAATTALFESNTGLAKENALRTEAIHQLESHTQHLNEIIRAQAALSQSELDASRFLNLVVERMLVITPADGAVVEMIDGDDMVYQAASGSVSNFVGFRLLRGSSLSGLCVDQREVLIAADTSTDLRVDRLACEKVGAGSMVAAPLFREGEAVGVVKILARATNAFDTADVQTLQLMAGLLGSALGHQLQFENYQSLLEELNAALVSQQIELQRRQESEARLLGQQRRTEAIIEASHEAFICMTDTGLVKEWNEQSVLTFGWSKQQALGQPLEMLILPERLREAHRKGLAHYLKTGEGPVLNHRIELPAVRSDGTEIMIELTITALHDGDTVEFPCFLRDITERKTRELTWQSRASIDQLTGLLNRAAFLDALQTAFERSSVESAHAIFYLDVDRFKQINDTYGHSAGDEVLQTFAEHLRAAVRESDVVGRLGGDEFCIALTNIKTIKNAEAIAEIILEMVQTPISYGDKELTISTSIGIAFVKAFKGNSELLIGLADAALYKAKQAGRNQFFLDVISTK